MMFRKRALLSTLAVYIWSLVTLSGSVWAVAPIHEGGSGSSNSPINGTSISQLGTVIVDIGTALLGVAGAFAVIMIIIGAFRYILASGDSKATASARNSITFAVIGLVIILLAVLIVTAVGKILGIDSVTSFFIPGPGDQIIQ